jgi:hypothetical protein
MLTPEQLAELQREADSQHRRVGVAAGFLLGLLAGLVLAGVVAVWIAGVW